MPEVITIHRHILQEQDVHPDAHGDLTHLLSAMALATKIISHHVNKAGLLDVLGSTGRVNVQGEQVTKLDDFANRTIKDSFSYSGLVAGIASEEDADIVEMPLDSPRGHYILLYDPLDGSSNIDANVTIGTIFAIYKKISPGIEPENQDFLQKGRELVAAGYAVYGSSTMLIYTTGGKVHGFTLDPEYGEYLLSHPNIRMPERCRCYSVNEKNYSRWDSATREYVRHLKESDDIRYRSTTARYIGSLVADFHRNLLYGGVFLYPRDTNNPEGKLRLNYECIPLAFIAEAAGGYASTGTKAILDIKPKRIHERSPLCIGNRVEVELYEQYVRNAKKKKKKKK
ncbi:MAG TPA: class 1 fructose-bisphosphatase [Myxococcales bacterium]|nr:class 1 fructose-bisphosphatase [Myxococcales bacterium]